MSEATPITRFERARKEAVSLLRRIADSLEAASPRQALEALERFGHPLQELDRAAQLVLWARATSGRGLRGAPVSAGSARPVAGFLASSVAAVHDEKTERGRVRRGGAGRDPAPRSRDELDRGEGRPHGARRDERVGIRPHRAPKPDTPPLVPCSGSGLP